MCTVSKRKSKIKSISESWLVLALARVQQGYCIMWLSSVSCDPQRDWAILSSIVIPLLFVCIFHYYSTLSLPCVAVNTNKQIKWCRPGNENEVPISSRIQPCDWLSHSWLCCLPLRADCGGRWRHGEHCRRSEAFCIIFRLCSDHWGGGAHPWWCHSWRYSVTKVLPPQCQHGSNSWYIKLPPLCSRWQSIWRRLLSSPWYSEGSFWWRKGRWPLQPLEKDGHCMLLKIL